MKTTLLSFVLFLSSLPVLAAGQPSAINREVIQNVVGEYVGTSVPYGEFIPNCHVFVSQSKGRISVVMTSDDGFTEYQDGKTASKLEKVFYPVRSVEELIEKMSGAAIGSDSYFALQETKYTFTHFDSSYMRWDLTDGALTSVDLSLDESGPLDFYRPSQREVSASCRQLRRLQ